MGPRGWFRPALLLGGAMALGAGHARGQDAPALPPLPATASEAGVAAAEPAAPALPPEVQVVRFTVPEGAKLEVLGPPPEPVPAGDGQGAATVGLRVGVGYRLRIIDLPNRPGAVLYPVVEVVGHLHRPPGIDPAKFPIRVPFPYEDVEDVVDRGRLVTRVVYLEDPAQALPLSLPKGEIPAVNLNPSEEPLRVAAALGRVMAIVRLGGRTPTAEEVAQSSAFGPGMAPCPFAGPGGRCPLPCGFVRGEPPPSGRPWLPADEFLCDGGDGGLPASFSGTGGLRGIDPRDAVVQFRDDRRARLLPTNRVCIYAPRFAAVRTSIGPSLNYTVQVLAGAETLQRQEVGILNQGPRRMTQNQTAELNRHRARPSALFNRELAVPLSEVRVLAEADVVTHVAGHVTVVGPQTTRNRQNPAQMRQRVKLEVIKSAESAVVTGIIQGANEAVMAWKPQELAGLEQPPNRPGLAVIKRVSVTEAEPGDVVTYSIQFRNMGNVPITSVSVVDSLLPRLEYVAGSARGPAGTVFTAGENRVGSTELRWDLPGALAPGAEGYVSFEAKVR
jgi:uncharacterized repeat protein (TIGR01451 family)